MARSRILTGLSVLLLALAAEALTAILLVEDWSQVPAGTSGIPPGWKSGQNWGTPAYDFVVEQEGAVKVLHLRSKGDSSTIAKEVKVDVKDTQFLEWRWKAVTLPRGGDGRKKATDDQALQLYVVFERFPSMIRSRIIGYIWDSTAPVGTIIKSEKTGRVTYVVVRSGPKDLGKWLDESRNVYEDYKRIYGEAPQELIKVVSLAIDSDDTQSSAEGYLGAIAFRTPNSRSGAPESHPTPYRPGLGPPLGSAVGSDGGQPPACSLRPPAPQPETAQPSRTPRKR